MAKKSCSLISYSCFPTIVWNTAGSQLGLVHMRMKHGMKITSDERRTKK